MLPHLHWNQCPISLEYAAGLPDYIFSLLVLVQPNETAVTEVIVRSPFEKFENPHESRT
jgi:hypothetical protein